MKKFITALLLMTVAGTNTYSQHQEVSDPPGVYKGKQPSTVDTTSLIHAFKSGTVNGHFRYFFMSTQNSEGLTDYYANAAGGGLRFETAKFHGFQMAISGFYIFNIGSSNLAKPDSITGQPNRYEIGLFDIEDPENKKDIDRLEEFYLKYNYKNSGIVLGRQLINTPFINLQDGRMRPSGVEGIWVDFKEIKNTRIEAGWIYSVSPRSTVKWFDVGESIGIYPGGVNEDGLKSGYPGKIESAGIAIAGVTTKINKNLDLKAWNMFTENVFNTAMLQADIKFGKKKTGFNASAQLIHQLKVNDGGHEDPAQTYFSSPESLSFGGKVGWKTNNWDAAVNYNRITAQGRYLVPREWGRDPFFTFMPRERNEGFGNVHAITARVAHHKPGSKLKTSLSAGYFDVPDVKDTRLNKYGLPSYTQVNADARFTFDGMLEGLEAYFLFVAKLKNGETYGIKKYEFNKVNMQQYNLVLNYHF